MSILDRITEVRHALEQYIDTLTNTLRDEEVINLGVKVEDGLSLGLTKEGIVLLGDNNDLQFDVDIDDLTFEALAIVVDAIENYRRNKQ